MKVLTYGLVAVALGFGVAMLGYEAAGEGRVELGLLPELPAVAATESARDAASRKTEALLDRNADDIVVEGQPLEEVLTRVLEKAGVGARVDWVGIEAAGVERKTPVTVRVKKVTWGKALDMIVAEAGGATNALDWINDGGVVVVSAKEKLDGEAYRVTRAYDAGFAMWDADDRSSRNDSGATELLALIKETVAPTTWVDNGGVIGSLRVRGHTLMVTTTEKHQREVAEVLAMVKLKEGISVRAYDIHDLLGAEDVRTAAGTAPAIRPGELTRAETIMQVIRTVVARDTWREPVIPIPASAVATTAPADGPSSSLYSGPGMQGGASSSMAEFDGKLYITTTAAIHEQIGTVLRLMREKSKVK